MQHLQIAYELVVIMIGFAALAIAGFWALRTQAAYLRDFCVLYALFTGLLVIEVVKKYLSLNVADYPAQAWFAISGVYQLVNFAVLVATLHFLLGIFQVHSRKVLTPLFLALMVVYIILVFSPSSAALDAEQNTIRLGLGFQIAGGLFFAAFTAVLAIGWGLLGRVWRTDKRAFVLGLLLFASVGYLETLLNLVGQLRSPLVTRAAERNFLYSSIPYALYGVFVIAYFLRYYVSPPPIHESPSAAFLEKYAITEREREIIMKVIQGKSNADIASELVISLATVKTHLHNIYTKIGVDSRYDLLARVRSGQ